MILSRFNRFAALALMTICILVAGVMNSGADIPRLISYQGHLTDDLGDPLPDGSYNLSFGIYSDSTGGAPLWSSASQPVEVASGPQELEFSF